MSVPRIIAIDGPAASGKSTLAQRLAERLGYLCFDTGVMYRALTWAALRRGVAPADEPALAALAEKLDIDITPPSKGDGRVYDVRVDDEDVTWEIRSPEVEAQVSIVSAYASVRKALSAQQRRIGLRGGVVMAGRDIGTVVLPEADLKIYLDASVEQRAMRRYREQMMRGEQISYEETLQAMQQRDRIDSTRDVAPLRPAEDAVIVNTDHLTVDQVVEHVWRLVHPQEQD